MNSLVLLLLFYNFIDYGIAKYEYLRTIYGYEESFLKNKQTFQIDSDFEYEPSNYATKDVFLDNTENILSKINNFSSTHNLLSVLWLGEGSNVVLCLAHDPAALTPSAVYISYDNGNNYRNKTNSFKLFDGSHATIEKFYYHPKYNNHLIFTDVRHNLLYISTNHGHDIKRIELNFTPSEVLFDEFQQSAFLVLDKSNSERKLWVTENFGNTFRLAQNFIKNVKWIKENDTHSNMVVQRVEPSGSSQVLYSSNLFLDKQFKVYGNDIKDFHIKGDYLFTTIKSHQGKLELYVSYKLQNKIKCVFDTNLKENSYFIVDVTNNRALVVVGHSDTQYLYVTENLNGTDGVAHFTLSLEDVLCYFPNGTWRNSWIRNVSQEAFVDIYKVEGLSGIYIASRVLTKPIGISLNPQHVGSVITFDHGRSWRLINAPQREIDNQTSLCLVQKNCSLHLNQKFSHLYSNKRVNGILSSKSAPGLLIATGVTGKSLKGNRSVYISNDFGLTWKKILNNSYFFNMGDHGGVLVAANYFKLNHEIYDISYSVDEGATWTKERFDTQNMKMYGLMTEPGENTTEFIIPASLTHQWIMIKVNLIKAFKYNCSKNDYRTWSPSQSEGNRNFIPCVLGKQLNYQRRLSDTGCYNGKDYDPSVSVISCKCNIYDYECDFGFVRFNNGGNCVRNETVLEDLYNVPTTCRPGETYRRTKGYRKIQGNVCIDGLENNYLPEEIPCPSHETQDFLLISHGKKGILRFNTVTKTVQKLKLKKFSKSFVMDFDIKNDCVYWADDVQHIICRQCLKNNELEILVAQDFGTIEGMALDWISNNLYFVDATFSKIQLIRTDISQNGNMIKTILTNDTLKKPRGIALHPRLGYIFWTDWFIPHPSINRADMDGTNVKMLFTKPIVIRPNGITIDYIAERVYWVDASLDYIASSDLQGDNFQIIASETGNIVHPFAIAVFKNTMYWNDWNRNAIFSADKDTFHDVQILQRQKSNRFFDVKIFGHGIQVGSNPCINNSCSYICVPKLEKSVCLCPDDMKLENNKCVYLNKTEPTNSTPLHLQQICGDDRFRCNNNLCISKDKRCDGENDCGDSSDETKCQLKTCSSNFFMCNDGTCIPKQWKCDWEQDCSDGSDETDCGKITCKLSEFICPNGQCIPNICEGTNDCGDGSDEINCSKSTCGEDQFICTNGQCIPNIWKCDGNNDCNDGSDEINCTKPSCGEDQFICTNGQCIPNIWKCDGNNDCNDGSDEINCTKPSCGEDQFICTNGQCIPNIWKCDGNNDCGDGSDEINCTKSTCEEDQFICTNGQCIPNIRKCDGNNDCGDGSDEINCEPPSCKYDQFHCKTDIWHCLPRIWRCDGDIDCIDGSDEADCNNKRCTSYEFFCGLPNNLCIHAAWVCDGERDCPNGRDEENCTRTTTVTPDRGSTKLINIPKYVACLDLMFKCGNGKYIPFGWKCDQDDDCGDGSDEIICPAMSKIYPHASPDCSLGYFSCEGTRCNLLAALHNKKLLCNDKYDESNCTKYSPRVYQILKFDVNNEIINGPTLFLYWWIIATVDLEFMPSISKVDENVWVNKSWTKESRYRFTNLEPFTSYNMTIYVKVANTTTIFSPTKYVVASTDEGIPTEPYNVKVQQRNSSHVFISWHEPLHPNGKIINYEISWYPPLPPMKLKLNGNETSHFLTYKFQLNITYSFYVIAYNRKYESHRSQVATLKFNETSTL